MYDLISLRYIFFHFLNCISTFAIFTYLETEEMLTLRLCSGIYFALLRGGNVTRKEKSLFSRNTFLKRSLEDSRGWDMHPAWTSAGLNQLSLMLWPHFNTNSSAHWASCGLVKINLFLLRVPFQKFLQKFLQRIHLHLSAHRNLSLSSRSKNIESKRWWSFMTHWSLELCETGFNF